MLPMTRYFDKQPKRLFPVWLAMIVFMLFVGGVCWLWFGHDRPVLRLPSYTMSKQQYYSMVLDPTASRSYLPDAKDLSSLEGYPSYLPLGDLLERWPANYVENDAWNRSLCHPSKGRGLYRFNYLIPREKALAEQLRKQELPFVVFNVPELDATAEGLFSLPQMRRTFRSVDNIVERSPSNEFMYYMVRNAKAIGRRFPDWTPPQEPLAMGFEDFLQAAERANGYDPSVQGDGREYLYMTLSSGEGPPGHRDRDWIRDALPFFEPVDSLFMSSAEEYRGIKCRFGMKGIIAACHFDSKRNWIAMIRGRKRYLLLPPEECSKLELYPRGHPSARHSAVQWSDLEQVRQYPRLRSARATEVVLRPGEMLYVPSYWFHYIISQDASIQCNCRSGESPKGRKAVTDCGYSRERKDGSLQED